MLIILCEFNYNFDKIGRNWTNLLIIILILTIDDVLFLNHLTNNPKLIFVCIQDGVFDKRPDLNLDVWKQDQCSKTLSGCRLRFKDYVGNDSEESKNRNGLPFGAFPATFSHENKQ